MAQTNEHIDYLERVNDGLKRAYEDGTLLEWLDDQLDVTQYYVKRDGGFEYSHSEILITCGGPDVRLYTDQQVIKYNYGHIHEDYYIYSEIIDELDSLLEC